MLGSKRLDPNSQTKKRKRPSLEMRKEDSNAWLCVGRSKFDEGLRFDFRLDPRFSTGLLPLSPKFILNTEVT